MWDRNRTKQQWLPFFTSSDHHTVISHHFQSAAIFRTEKSSWFSWVHRGVCVLLAPLRAAMCLRLLLRMPVCWAVLEELPSAAVPGRGLLHHPLLFHTHNEPKRERRDKNDVLRNVCELCCCASPALQWSSFLVVLFLFLQGCFSAIHFKYLPLWNFLFLKTLMAFILVEEKMGNPASRQHMNGKLAGFIFFLVRCLSAVSWELPDWRSQRECEG